MHVLELISIASFTALGLIFPHAPRSRNIEKSCKLEEWKGLAWFPSTLEE